MRCKKAEHLILQAWDFSLAEEQQRALSDHLIECEACRALEQEYRGLRDTLQGEDFPEPKPYFWERLQPRLGEKPRLGLMPLWKDWGLRAIPCSLAVILVIILAGTFLISPQNGEISQSGILLRDQNPFQDTLLLAEDEPENPNMLLLFSSLDESGSPRRYFP
jgi:predicted anti-sigma-YlaC factor YlaD